jgi:glycosyltransferase involved in cell wall biosynthesis
MRPVISVIITEYWPRNFLKYAVRSVLNQTLDKGLYELIVVKRFRNPEIDRLIESHSGKVIILSDAPIGHYLAVGVNESDGEVVAFLDDDDAFMSRKLEYVYEHMYSRDDVGYYYHLAYIIDGQNKLLGKSFGGPTELIVINPRARGEVKRVLRKYGLIGSLMSATVIRRELITEYLRLLETIVAGQDTFAFLASLNSNYLVVHEPLNLSFYRVHGQQVSLPWGTSPRELLVRFARQAVLNQHSFHQLSIAFPIIKDLPFRHNPLCGYHYNVLGLMVLGLDRKLVASTGLIALWRGLFDKSIWRVLAGLLGITYVATPRKVVKALLLKYYEKRLVHE